MSRAFTVFQQVRTGPGGSFDLYLTTTRILAQDRTRQPLLLVCFGCVIDTKSYVTAKVQRLIDENTFLRSHASRYASLPSASGRCCAGWRWAIACPKLLRRCT